LNGSISCLPSNAKRERAFPWKFRWSDGPLSAAALKSLRDEHTRTIEPARAQAAEALQLERRLSDLVNEAYGLTPDEVSLVWETAPPRMPFALARI
jgi:hypothetical protein